MNYQVLLEGRAQKELEALPGVILKRVDVKLQALAKDPRPPGATKLQGKEGQGWRIRVGDYRILYTVDDTARVVGVYRIKHRREVYR